MEGKGINVPIKQEPCVDPIIHAVAIKPAAFKETAVSGWFMTLEAQFSLNRVTSETTRYLYAFSSLPPDLAYNLPTSITSEQNYSKLKDAVIEIFEQSKPEQFEKMLKKTTLSGRPSMFLLELNAIANKVGVGEDLVRHKFVNALPSNIAPVIAAQKTLSLSQLGTLADELMPLLTDQVTSVSHYSTQYAESNGRRNNSDQRYRRESTDNANQRSSRNESNIPYGLKPYRPNQRPKICKAHLYYGRTARTCKQWCQWPQKNSCRILPNSRSSSPAPSEN